ncbi:MAG TPA: hypothetical protein GXZ92_03435 [Clostridiales bacterium]|jgi:transcription elongation factor Elf1|nr:hypothetical protein [Clostridiales bacterium]
MTKKKRITIIIASCVLLASIAAAIVLPILLKDDVITSYSYENENRPLEYGAVNKMIFQKKFSELLKYTFLITDKNNHIANALLGAMSRARVPTEKMLAFVDYLRDFADSMIKDGFSVWAGQFEDGEADFDFDFHFNNFFETTGFNEIELSRLLFELLADFAGEDNEYIELLNLLERDNFVDIVSSTLYGYKMISGFSAQGGSAAQARVMQGLLYAIGNRYVKNIQRMGYENIEKLLLINFDSDKEYDNITQEEYRVYSSFMSCAQGKIANILYVFGNTLISTDAKAFERLFAYFSAQDKECEKAKEDLIVSHISLAKAVNAGIQSSFAYAHKSQISDMDSFIDSYARLIASYKEMTTTLKNQSQNNGEEENEEDEEEFDYQEYYAAVYARLAAFTQDVASLSQTKTLQGLSPQQKEELYLKALNMWNLFSDAGDLFEDAFAAANVNFFLRVIDLNGFLKRNRRALQDLIRDSIAGLIGWDIKDLEDLYDGNY